MASKAINPFESLRKANQHGAEYWSARDIQAHLGYEKWANFEKAIKKAAISCERSGNVPQNHIASAGNMVGVGSGAKRRVPPPDC